MKKLITICLLMLITYNVIAQSKKNNSKKYYYVLTYYAKMANYKYAKIIEQKLTVSTERPDTFGPKLQKQYVAFITKNHPEYYVGHISGLTVPYQIDFQIRAMAGNSGPHESEKYALLAMKAIEDEYQERHNRDPDVISVIKVNEFVYKEE